MYRFLTSFKILCPLYVFSLVIPLNAASKVGHFDYVCLLAMLLAPVFHIIYTLIDWDFLED
jgi:hypothetical protein